MNKVNIVLCIYLGEVNFIVGECELNVEYNGFKGCLLVVVIMGEVFCLIGFNQFWYIFLNWREIFYLVIVDKDLNEMLEVYKGLG